MRLYFLSSWRHPVIALRLGANDVSALMLGLALAIGSFPVGQANAKTTVKEYEQVFPTYPYSDPDPVPAMTRIYPYFRYDGFTAKPLQKKWKVVELSNDYVQVLVLPEIGGKVWAAIDKTTGKPFLYYNRAVKFRDVSMRGPWTSGGIEPNYGIMGHTPNCFSPVDYIVRRNPDGSASCIIGTLDLLTRTTWRLEINLRQEDASFSTRSFWHNATPLDQAYYTWMNVGIKSAGNLQFIHPGTHFIGHDGKAHPWPLDPGTGRDLSWYERNDFGSYKSYHVVGSLAEFFGGYWHDDDFGMAHCAPYGDKPGRKIWIWGLSREGMIWEDLLTDRDGQYVEVQSGRMFNQADSSSSLTPFKHTDFPPYATDTWTEHWLPVKGIKGFVSASPWGALNVTNDAGRLIIRVCPARPLVGSLDVFDGGRLLVSRPVKLTPMQPVEEVVQLTEPPRALRVCVAGDKLRYSPWTEDALSRPLQSPAGFDWSSLYGHYLRGKEEARQRSYQKAAELFEECLKQDTNYAPALVEMAQLANRRSDPQAALRYARHALSIDTYDPAANYQFGLASVALQQAADAKDAFALAALAPAWRSAAGTELAKEFLREHQYDRALDRAREAVVADGQNLDALQVCACAERVRGNEKAAAAAEKVLLELDALSHFARFEQYLRGKRSAKDFTSLIRNELPQQTFLEMAAWYVGIGREADAARLLELAPPTAEVLYWLAYVRREPALLERAEAASAEFVFPFRREAIPVFEWAAQQRKAWQPDYFLALIWWRAGDRAEAMRLLERWGDQPRFAPFYAARGQLGEEILKAAGGTAAKLEGAYRRNLERAAELDPGQWRYGTMLARHYLDRNDPAAALQLSTDYARRFPKNDRLGLLRAKALIQTGQYSEAAEFLGKLEVLPAEGTTEARALFHEAFLRLALDRYRAGAYDEAFRLVTTAREWPERLGAGKPYPADLDERLEDWFAAKCLLANQRLDLAKPYLEKVLAIPARPNGQRTGDLIRALALKEQGRVAEAEELVGKWQAQDAASEVGKWGRSLVRGVPTPLPAAVNSLDYRVLAGLQ